VDIRYLGVSGLYVEWAGHAFLTSPFFSRPSLGRVGFGRIKPHRPSIRAGLEGIPLDKIGAIFVGHGHYDHLGDVPLVVQDYATRAAVFANTTSQFQLASYPDVEARTVDLEEHLGQWISIHDATGAPLPLRVMPLASTHACVTSFLRWAGGSAKKAWAKPWTKKRYFQMKQGRALALLMDLLHSDGSVAFRIYYQEAASHGGTGEVPEEVLWEHPVDLAALTTASHYLARDYPGDLLDNLRPRHILATHYEDFFRKPARPARLVPMLTSHRASTFLEHLAASPPSPDGSSRPENRTCGPSNEVYTLPLLGEWMRFRLHPQQGSSL